MFVGVCAVQRLFICLCCEALAATVGQLWEEASGASSGRKLVVHGSVKPWQLLSVSSGRKLVCLGAVKPHCTAQPTSAASSERRLVFPNGMQGPTVR